MELNSFFLSETQLCRVCYLFLVQITIGFLKLTIITITINEPTIRFKFKLSYYAVAGTFPCVSHTVAKIGGGGSIATKHSTRVTQPLTDFEAPIQI
jgi:hypothetical protein